MFLRVPKIKALSIIIVNHTKWVLQKYQLNACGVRDGMSGDMFALSLCNLIEISGKVFFIIPHTKVN